MDGAVRFSASRIAVDEMTIRLGQHGIAIRELVRERVSLEDRFFELVEQRSATAEAAS